ncbi:MAG: hypothetical protein KDC35_17380 [Acidobacteria bacterium]|nr:hypothetical protein [Acidobacteriota bacterium]
MRWSKLKKVIEEGFAPSIAGRVTLLTTRYRHAHDQEGRWALLIDGKEVGGMGCIVADREERDLIQKARLEEGVSASSAQAKAMAVLAENGRHTLPMFNHSVFSFTQLSINESLDSADAVLKSLAYLDRRLGKRRLAILSASPPKTLMERACLSLRLNSERISISWA